MITKEQIKSERAGFAVAATDRLTPSLRERYALLAAICDLALSAIEGEADRRLGARVRAWVDGDSAASLDAFADVIAGPDHLGSEQSPAVELVRAIASALREEGER